MAVPLNTKHHPQGPRWATRTTEETFQCRRCGACCTGEGVVNVSEEECERIARFLGLSLEEFLARYTVHEEGFERALIDGEGGDAPCVFLQRNEKGLASCRIQGEAKPRQCRDFPTRWRRADTHKRCKAFADDGR